MLGWYPPFSIGYSSRAGYFPSLSSGSASDVWTRHLNIWTYYRRHTRGLDERKTHGTIVFVVVLGATCRQSLWIKNWYSARRGALKWKSTGISGAPAADDIAYRVLRYVWQAGYNSPAMLLHIWSSVKLTIVPAAKISRFWRFILEDLEDKSVK